MSDLAIRLTKKPSLAEFCEICDDFSRSSRDNQPSHKSLEVFMAVLENQQVPLFITDEKGQNALKSLFSSPYGLGCLISRVRVASTHEIEVILQLVQMILESSTLQHLLTISRPEATSLIWGSKVLNVMSSGSLGIMARVGDAHKISWLGDVHQYSRWLSLKMINEGIDDPVLFDKGVKLGSPKEFFDPWLTYVDRLRTILHQLRPSQLQFVLSHALIPLLPSNPCDSGRLLIDLQLHSEIVLDLCHRLPARLPTIRSAIVLARERKELYEAVLKLVNQWANKTRLATSALLNQQSLVQCLIGSCPSLSAEQANSIVHSPVFAEGITNHLHSTSTNLRELGTLVAETFAKRAGSKLEFGISYSGYDWWIGYDNVGDKPSIASDSISTLQQILNKPTDTTVHNGNSSGNMVDSRGTLSSTDVGDSDDADSDVTVDPPFYLKDLITYLRSDKYEEIVSGLEHGSTLILRKASFGSEVSHYAEQVLLSACSLSDKYSINNFNDMRQSILNAVLVADPKQVSVIVNLLVTGDWSLAQKQSLLATLAYAAHTLAKGESLESHELLPSKLHKLFISGYPKLINDKNKNLNENENEKYAKSVTESSHLNNRQAKILRRSKHLDQSKDPIAKNNFSKISNQFFFPLIAAQPPLRKSSYDAIIYAQWLRTLAIIVVEAYPTNHMPDMIREMWNLLKSLAFKMKLLEGIIQEAVYACLSLIISVGADIIVFQHASDVGRLYDQLVASLADLTNTNAQTQSLAQDTVLQIAQLIEKVKCRFIGQLN